MRKLLDRTHEWPGVLTHDQIRSHVKTVPCGPECEWCGPAVGIAVSTSLDHIGDVYPEATDVVLRDGEWVVYSYDEGAWDQVGLAHQTVVARYPAADVVVIRNMPSVSRLFGHTVYDGPEVEGL